MWHIFWRGEVRQGTLGVDGRGWGPAGNTGRGYSRLRSGREHWANGRGWGPAWHIGRGWLWLRSDREHCGSRVAVGRGGRGGRRGGGRGGGGEEEERRRRGGGEEEQATDIKSNNPHLAGGEKNIPQRNPGISWFGKMCYPFIFEACSGGSDW